MVIFQTHVVKPRWARGKGLFTARRVNIARFACNIQVVVCSSTRIIFCPTVWQAAKSIHSFIQQAYDEPDGNAQAKHSDYYHSDNQNIHFISYKIAWSLLLDAVEKPDSWIF